MQEGPLVIGLGFDFAVFWSIGRAVLAGGDPYSVWGSFYPPAMSYAYGLFALLPIHVAFVLWTTACVAFLAVAVGIRRAPAWLLFAPVTMALAAGQVDLLFVALATLLRRKGWQSIAAAALITLKPQLALILLPWHLVRWDVKRLLRFGLAATAVQVWPVFFDPTIFSRWIDRVASLTTSSAARHVASPGLWSLYGGSGTFWFLLASGLVLALSLALSEHGGRAGALVAFPTAMFYDASTIVGAAPAIFLVPLSWLALALAHDANSFAPLAIVSLVTFLWQWSKAQLLLSPKLLRDRSTGRLFAYVGFNQIAWRFGEQVHVVEVRKVLGPFYQPVGFQSFFDFIGNFERAHD